MTTRMIAFAVIAALLLTGGAVAAPQALENGTNAVQPTTPALTSQEAEAAALTHAGLTAQQVTDLHSHQDMEDGIPEWEVEFRQGDYEFDYSIHAETGAVLKSEKEYDPSEVQPAPTEAPAAPPASSETTAPRETAQSGHISATEAKSAALSHAGLSSGQVSGLRASFDYDDGIPEYEVEFRYNGYEYDYEIHAETGRILSWDKDRDD